MIVRLPPLADTLALMLPDEQDTMLLRACLSDRASAEKAWRAWLGAIADLPTVLVERPRTRRFLPLLFHVLSGNGIATGEPSLSILRAATLWEERRAIQLRPIVVQVLAALRRAGIDAVLLKGVALAETIYPRFHLRHCHDMDLLVSPGALSAASDTLRADGFRQGSMQESGATSLVLLHEGGLPVSLHTRLWPSGTREGLLVDFCQRTTSIQIDGEPTATLSPMDTLLHVCGHAGIGAGPGNWTWIIDAAMILRRHAAGAEDWARLVRGAEASGFALLVAARFSVLAQRFDVPIPETTLCALVDAAWRSPESERDAVISSARAESGAAIATMLKQSGWHSRIEIVRWGMRRIPRRLRRIASLR